MQKAKSPVLRYGVMLLCIGIAFLLAKLVPQLRDRESFLVFVAAVAISAWYGGRGPGLLSCLVAAFITNFYIYQPPGVFTLTMEAVVPAVVFLLVAITISSLTTQLTLAEEKTRQQQQWLEAILSSIGDAVMATDAKGKIRYVNAASAELTGRACEQLNGNFLKDVLSIRPTQDADSSTNPWDVLEGNAPIQRCRSMVLIRNSADVPVECTVARISDENHQFQGAVFAIRDVTERELARTKIISYQEDLRKLAADLCLAEERERRNISTALHDRIVQSLALSSIKLGTLRETLSDKAVLKSVDEITAMLKQILTEIRSLTFELSPPILYQFGLEAALEWLCQHFQKNHPIKCAFKDAGGEAIVNQDVRIALFQSVRELLTNVVKHADASRLTVLVEKMAGNITVRVEDDGKGFDDSSKAASEYQTHGLGLFSLRERIRYLGGSFSLNSKPGNGTSVVLSVPIRRD